MHIGKCEQCGKETEYKFACRVKRYCSYSCSNTAKWGKRTRAEIVTLLCEICKKPFSLSVASLRVREKTSPVKFCSLKCKGVKFRNELTFTELLCSHCGIKFKKRTDKIGEKNYCCRACSDIGRRNNGPWSESSPNKEARREYFRNYLKENREKINNLSSKWSKNNRAYRNYIQQVRRAAGILTFDEWKKIVDSAKCCLYCGATDRLEVDHIHPVSKGGKTEKNNLQVLCRRCNASKGNRAAPL